MKFRRIAQMIAIPAIISTLLTACGGGSEGGTTIGTSNNTVSITQTVFNAGQSATLTANTTMHKAVPTKMQWTASNMTGDASTPLVINNADCASASFSAPTTNTILGSGLCVATITIPKTLSSGTWKISNTATSASGAVSDSIDITITALKPSGFKTNESSTPYTAGVGVLTPLNAPFTVNDGYSVANVKYQWTSDASNATAIRIIGAKNPTPTVTTDTAGFYKVNVVITADVNGSQETATGSAYISVQAATTPTSTPVLDISAGDTQTLNTGEVAHLQGTVTSQNATTGVTYQYAWRQVGTTPAIATISNAKTLNATFIPTVAGTYTFNLNVTATTSGGVTVVDSITQVVVSAANSAGTSLFVLTANAGLAQSAATNEIISLTGTQTTQGTATGLTYAYMWTQTGTTPATVTLSTPNSETASFTPTVNGTYSFNLTVTATLPDGTTRVASSDTQVVIGGEGAGFSVSAGDAVVQGVKLSAMLTGQITPQGAFNSAIFNYTWKQVGTTPAVVAISNINSLNASFIPTVEGIYTFTLTVTATQNGITSTQSSNTQLLITP